MRRLLSVLLLAAAGTANAALPRVVLDAPLAPAPAPSFLASPAAGALSARSAAAPLLSLPSAPAAPAPVQAPALAAPALAALPIPSHELPAAKPAAKPAAAAAAPRAIDALRANAPLADALSASLKTAPLEDAAPALEKNFAAAAAMDPDGVGHGSILPSFGAAPAAPEAHAALLPRLLERVTLDDGGAPERRAALVKAFERMLESPSARALAERFLADGASAVVRFEAFEGSRLYEANGRKIFYAPRAFTEWQDGRVVVRLNQDYLGTDPEFQHQDLPPTLAHELLGHGLWYSRAVRENAFQAFHHHELNETNARLVGWLVDFELDRRFEENGAWNYLQDPAGFLNHLKLRLTYYALTFSNSELARPIEALEARSAAAKEKRARLETELANHVSWNPVIDHFARHHGVAETRLRALRGYMADTEQSYKDEIAVMDALIAEVDATVGRMKAEPDRMSERYLQSAAAHPLFADLQRETQENGTRLLDLVRRTPAQPGDESEAAARRREDHWRGQLTFEEMVAMYRRDREQNPAHWSR